MSNKPPASKLPQMIQKALESRLTTLRKTRDRGRRLGLGVELIAALLETSEALEGVLYAVKAELGLRSRVEDPPRLPAGRGGR